MPRTRKEDSTFNASAYRNAFIKENYDRINLTLPARTKEQLKEIAAKHGTSVNPYIIAAINAKLEADGENFRIVKQSQEE